MLRPEQEKKDKKKVKEKEMEQKERAEMAKWMTRLRKVCGLKSKKIETDSVYTKASDENNQPEEAHEQQENVPTEEESSPTLSSASSAYIPISECFTGKPIHLNDKAYSNGKETVYYNTSFPFPPKVNWATHPAKKEHSPETSSALTPSSVPTPSPSSASVPVKAKGLVVPDSKVISHHSAQSSQSNPIPSPAEPTAAAISPTSATSPTSDTATLPPQVNRKLKPDVNKPLLSPSPNTFPAFKHTSGAMTLPSRNNFRQLTVGPIIDRTRKPPESPLLLGPTPAQMKNQNMSARHHGSSQFSRSNTSTLPASPRRRAGPIISPNEHRLPVYHEYDQPDDLQGTYLQIDCKASGGNDTRPGESTRLHNSKVNLHKKGVPAQVNEGSVEYRLIDHVKTKALNKMREEREEQLQLVRTNPISLKSFT